MDRDAMSGMPEEETTEVTEKMSFPNLPGKFEIVLDIVKVNTNLVIEER